MELSTLLFITFLRAGNSPVKAHTDLELSTLVFITFLLNIMPLAIVFSRFMRTHSDGDVKERLQTFIKRYTGLCISFVGSVLISLLFLLVSLNLLETYENAFSIITNIALTFLIAGLLLSGFKFLSIRYVAREIQSKDSHKLNTPVHPSDTPTPKIFISYRRSDSAAVTGRIYDRLAQQFGAESLFKDVDNIPLGVDFRQQLDQAIAVCTSVIIVIGRDWLTTTDDNGRPRLHNKTDIVRIEIESALSRGIPVIPVLVGDANMPDEHDLPDTIKTLAYRNGIPIRHDPDFHKDMNRLISGIQKGTKTETY